MMAHLYVMQRDDGLVKVGYSVNPHRRADEHAKCPIWNGKVVFEVAWMSEPMPNAREAEWQLKELLGIRQRGKGSRETLDMPVSDAIEYALLALCMVKHDLSVNPKMPGARKGDMFGRMGRSGRHVRT